MRGWVWTVMWVLPFVLGAQDDKAVTAVRTALADGKPYKARRLCDAQLSGKAPRPEFLVWRAEAQNRIGEYEGALADAREAMGKGVAVHQAEEMAGEALYGLGSMDSALVMLDRSLAEDATPAKLQQRALVLKALDRKEEALRDLDEALRLDPALVSALRERAELKAAKGDTAGARADLDRALDQAPDDPVTWNSSGYLHALSGDHVSAIKDYDKAIKLNPNYSYAFNNRGWSRFLAGDTARALKDIRLAGRKNRFNPYVYRNLAVIALASGDTVAACRNLQTALQNGFATLYGSEVNDLQTRFCASAAKPQVPASKGAKDVPASPPRDNAPGGTPRRNNAP